MDRPLKEQAVTSSVGIQLVENGERLLWQAHRRAAELVDDEPGVVSRMIFNAVHAKWRHAFLSVGK